MLVNRGPGGREVNDDDEARRDLGHDEDLCGRRSTALPEDRAAKGRAARTSAPRSAHGDFEPSPDRADPMDVIERQSATRLQELVPIRYGRMAESPFRFYRGAAAIMAGDLAGTPVRTH